METGSDLHLKVGSDLTPKPGSGSETLDGSKITHLGNVFSFDKIFYVEEHVDGDPELEEIVDDLLCPLAWLHVLLGDGALLLAQRRGAALQDNLLDYPAQHTADDYLYSRKTKTSILHFIKFSNEMVVCEEKPNMLAKNSLPLLLIGGRADSVRLFSELFSQPN